jgi:hypothetical protein
MTDPAVSANTKSNKYMNKIQCLIVFICLLKYAHSSESLYTPESLITQEGILKVIWDKYPDIERIYEIYDIKNTKGLLLLLNKSRNKCLIVFGGKITNVEYKINGKMVEDISKVFIEEKVAVKKESPNVAPNPTSPRLFIVGHWINKPDKNTIIVNLYSDEGNFTIKWKSDEEIPDVIMRERGQ